jgi:hypothetical protein
MNTHFLLQKMPNMVINKSIYQKVVIGIAGMDIKNIKAVVQFKSK